MGSSNMTVRTRLPSVQVIETFSVQLDRFMNGDAREKLYD